MSTELVTFQTAEKEARLILETMRGWGLSVEDAGAQRGMAEVTTTIVVAVPTIGYLMRTLDQIRRDRICRTIFHTASDGSLTIIRDTESKDGRVFSSGPSGALVELEDSRVKNFLNSALPTLPIDTADSA